MFPKTSKILIVDDQKTMRYLVRRHLLEMGYQNIYEANDGAKGWPLYLEAMAERKPMDLIISDMMMPLMNGVQFLRKVRGYHQNKTTPFILLTAENDKDTVIEAMTWKVNAYIVKPFTKESLQAKIAEVHKNVAAKAA